MKNKKGFTLVEILIVVGIIGIILTSVAVALNSKSKEMRDLKRLTDINALRDALQLVKNESGSYLNSYCALSTVSACGAVTNSELKNFLPGLSALNDPSSTVACQSQAACESSACNYT
ncbi:MAG: prepilin-type N-terminal cleavage/methylation domain-containing protein, partial [Parcubacteria group bacterium]